MRIAAYAKVNLLLAIGERRPDGLHTLVSVMQAVSLADTVTLVPSDATGVAVRPAGAAPDDDSNLALRAARAFAAVRGVSEGVYVEIDKRIPPGAGLAGGSADAAATLVGLNELWDARVSKKGLEKIAIMLGSDVPFCVRGGTALVSGAGEDLSALACPVPLWWVLGLSDTTLSTREVYEEFDRLRLPGTSADPHATADALARGEVARLGASLRNDLEQAALSLAPGLAGGREALLAAGAMGAVMTGSGSTWCGLADGESHAIEVAENVRDRFARVEVVRSMSHGPRVLTR